MTWFRRYTQHKPNSKISVDSEIAFINLNYEAADHEMNLFMIFMIEGL